MGYFQREEPSTGKRRYHSPRRAAGAAQTRAAIIEAAVRLHGQGVTDLPTLAQEAGVALPTVQRHFPTREVIFAACTAHVRDHLTLPSLEVLAHIEDPGARLLELVRQVYALHEATFGVTWTAFQLEQESPAMAQARARSDAFIAAAVAVLLQDPTGHPASAEQATAAGFACGLLNPLTYRALRLKGGLTPEQASDYTACALAAVLGLTLPEA
jgi:AcrR family transcriptional regulator